MGPPGPLRAVLCWALLCVPRLSNGDTQGLRKTPLCTSLSLCLSLALFNRGPLQQCTHCTPIDAQRASERGAREAETQREGEREKEREGEGHAGGPAHGWEVFLSLTNSTSWGRTGQWGVSSAGLVDVL